MSLVGVVGILAAQPAPAQVAVASAAYGGLADGAVVHAQALNNGTTTLADVDEAYAGAAVNSGGFGTNINSQINTLVQAADASKKSGARGAGVELGLGANNPVATANALITQKAVATAPPNSGLIDNKTNIAIDPVLNVTLAEGKAQANWDTDPSGANGCVLGTDLSNGFGHLTNATAVGSPSPNSLVNAPGELSTTSHLRLVPQTDPSGNPVGTGAVGLMSEDIQTYAPIGIGGIVTITVVGPIHLRAVATGVQGQAYMQYGPPDGTPGTTPILTIQTVGGIPVTTITAQQLVGQNGLNLDLGIAQVTVATQPHALGGATTSAPVAANDGSSVSGEVDLVKVAVPTLGLADIRVGHMEAAATVPPGGILCQIDVSKEAQPANVNPGDTFNYIIHVHNPHACTLTGVKVVDTVSTTSGIVYSILGETPPADSSTSTTLTWNDIGPLAPGVTKDLVVNMKVGSNSAGGTFTEKASVTASCAIANAQGTSTIAVPAAGSATIQLPTVSGGRGAALPVTGGLTGRYYAVALIVALGALGFGRRGLKALLGSRG